MKIRTNFSQQTILPVNLMIALLLLTILLLAYFSIDLVFSAYRHHTESEVLLVRKLKLEEKLTAMGSIKTVSLPEIRDLAAFKEQLKALGDLEKNRGIDPSLLMAKLEGVLPKSVYLASLQYQRESGEVLLLAESDSTASLALFLHQLEQEAGFSGVLLVRQLQEGDGNKKRIQYSIKFTGSLL